MPDVELRTPLVAVADLPHRGHDIEIRELPGQGYVNLRGDASQRAFNDAVQAVCGVVLPATANSVSDSQPPCALWLGPDEWLLRLPGETDAATAVIGLESALGEHFYAANDVSSAQTVLRMAGPRVGELLAKGCTLDLHPRVFGTGRCAQTNLAKTAAILMPVDDAGSMDVIVRRSFADYLARWLVDACR